MLVRGWAAVPILCLAMGGGLLFGAALGRAFSSPIMIPAGFLIDALVVAGLGIRANRDGTSHAAGDIPVQYLAVIPLGLAVMASFWTVSVEHDRIGWPVYLVPAGVLVLAVGVAVALMNRYRSRRTAAAHRKTIRSADSPDVAVDIRLTVAEALDGATKTIEYRNHLVCPKCGGSGHRGDSWLPRHCRRCKGTGLGHRNRTEVTVRIPPGVGTGTKIRVRGKGVPARGKHLAGDLVLRVVEPTNLAPTSGVGSSEPPSQPGNLTVTTHTVQVTVDGSGISVSTRRVGAGKAFWFPHAEVGWSAIRSLIFSTDPHDSVIALFALPKDGPRRFLVDAKQISGDDWDSLAAAIHTLTDGRLHLDPPRSTPERLNGS
jgi:hypothetical protein